MTKDDATAKALKELSERFWEDEALPVLSDYVRNPCLSPEYDPDWNERGDIASGAAFLADWASSRPIDGLSVEVVSLEGRTPLVCCEVEATEANKSPGTTVIYGHFDKQPPLGEWRSGLSPYEPVRQGDKLYGRGTADDGYSLFAALGAIELAERSGIGHGHIVVIVEGSEESGSPDLPAYLEELSPRFGPNGPVLVICLDSGAADYERLWVTTSLRGLVAATLEVRVLKEGIHSGLGGGVVPDSFRLLRLLLDRVENAETGEVTLSACDVEVPEIRSQQAAELVSEVGAEGLDRYPTVAGLRLSGGKDTVSQVLAKTWGTSLALVGIDGMPALRDAGNVLRPHTSARLSMRIPPSAPSGKAADELIERLSADPPENAEVEVRDVAAADGFDAPSMASWLEDVVAEASRTQFGERPGAMGEGGSIPFLAELQSSYPEAQFLVTGVLGPESNADGPNEMFHLPTAKALTAAMALVVSRTGDGTDRSIVSGD